MGWAQSTLDRLDALKQAKDEADAAADASFERLHALGRELFAARGAEGQATHKVPGGTIVYGVSMRDHGQRQYHLSEITLETATLCLQGGVDELPPPDDLGKRCHEAWADLNRTGAACNGAARKLEMALREEVLGVERALREKVLGGSGVGHENGLAPAVPRRPPPHDPGDKPCDPGNGVVGASHTWLPSGLCNRCVAHSTLPMEEWS